MPTLAWQLTNDEPGYIHHVSSKFFFFRRSVRKGDPPLWTQVCAVAGHGEHPQQMYGVHAPRHPEGRDFHKRVRRGGGGVPAHIWARLHGLPCLTAHCYPERRLLLLCRAHVILFFFSTFLKVVLAELYLSPQLSEQLQKLMQD